MKIPAHTLHNGPVKSITSLNIVDPSRTDLSVEGNLTQFVKFFTHKKAFDVKDLLLAELHLFKAFSQMTMDTKLSRIVLYYGDDHGSVNRVMDFNKDAGKFIEKLSKAHAYFDCSGFTDALNRVCSLESTDIETLDKVIDAIEVDCKLENIAEFLGLNEEDSSALEVIIAKAHHDYSCI